jgi:hypothetical protein
VVDGGLGISEGAIRGPKFEFQVVSLKIQNLCLTDVNLMRSDVRECKYRSRRSRYDYITVIRLTVTPLSLIRLTDHRRTHKESPAYKRYRP